MSVHLTISTSTSTSYDGECAVMGRFAANTKVLWFDGVKVTHLFRPTYIIELFIDGFGIDRKTNRF